MGTAPEPRLAIDPGGCPDGLVVHAWHEGELAVVVVADPVEVEELGRRHFSTADRCDVYDGDSGRLVAVVGVGWSAPQLFAVDGEASP